MLGPISLIPSKKGEAVRDVRGALRGVFREALPHEGPRAPAQPAGACNPRGELADTAWYESYAEESKKLTEQENELKQSFALKLCRKQVLNEYRLQRELRPRTPGSWRAGLVSRRDLAPTVLENAAGDASLWVRNCLGSSSVCFHPCRCSTTHPPQLSSVDLEEYVGRSHQSISFGPYTKPVKPLSRAPPALPREPQHINCVPSEVEFVNFVIGKCRTENIRIINMSKFELRIALKPPAHNALNIEIISKRGLVLSAGASIKIKLRFKPINGKTIEDEILVRVNKGKSVAIKIKCIMQPPLLKIVTGAADLQSYKNETIQAVPVSDNLELGARLLGDVHCTPWALYSESNHARFFIMTQDDWENYFVNQEAAQGYLSLGNFTLQPVYFHGGGWLQGSVWFRAPAAGMHCLALKVISSTAVPRNLTLVADSIIFHPTNISIEAQEKNFDICSEDDPACKYYVNLGEAFPGHVSSSTVQLINHSAVSYSYEWRSRPWRACSCYRDRGEGSSSSSIYEETVETEGFEHKSQLEDERNAKILPSDGTLGPREVLTVTVSAQNSVKLGWHRTVFMLIFKDIPEECIPADYEPMDVETKTLENEPIPGVEPVTRKTHSFVTCQMEVWWQTVPLWFVMIPPALYLPHSLKVSAVVVEMCACQMSGREAVRARLLMGARALCSAVALPAARAPSAARISVTQPLRTRPALDVATLESEGGEWRASTRVRTRPSPRAPRLAPPALLRPRVYPGDQLVFEFSLRNDTYFPIQWRASLVPWRDAAPPARCARAACPRCPDRACRCDALQPAAGRLPHQEYTQVIVRFTAPETDGVYASFLSVSYSYLPWTPHECGCARAAPPLRRPAALLAYRVVTPAVVLRARRCSGHCIHDGGIKCTSHECWLDGGARGAAGGTAALRPRRPIFLGQRACYRLLVANTTPMPTTLTWDDTTDGNHYFRVNFIPNEIRLGEYEKVEMQVTVEGVRVCRQRVRVCAGRLRRSPRPVLLPVDVAVAGLEVVLEIPLGGDLGYATFKLIQKENTAPMNKQQTVDEIFVENDRRIRINRENRCYCKKELVYISVKKRARRPRGSDEEDYTPPEIVTEPPVSEVCACAASPRPPAPAPPGPLCMQFRDVPLLTERRARITLRNASPARGRWSARARRHPLQPAATVRGADRWRQNLGSAGVGVWVRGAGELRPRRTDHVDVLVFADCWGLYHDQILIQIEGLPPVVVDVWVEAVGAALRLPVQPPGAGDDDVPRIWISRGGSSSVLAVNDSRAELRVRTDLLSAHEDPRDRYPFRLYIRFYDTLPPWCPCVGTDVSDSYGSVTVSSSDVTEYSTGVELYLAPDFGYQDHQYYTVEPAECTINAGDKMKWKLTMKDIDDREPIPDTMLVLHTEPTTPIGSFVARPPLRPRALRVTAAARDSALQLSCCRQLVVLNALHLPTDTLTRVRKHVTVRNAGGAALRVWAAAEEPWAVRARLPLLLPPNTSAEMEVEVTVEPQLALAAPEPTDGRPRGWWRTRSSALTLHDQHSVLATLPLELRIEYPLLQVEPKVLDFHFVKHGDYRKTYFSVWHSSSTEILDVDVSPQSETLSFHPTEFTVAPRTRVRVYVMFEPKWDSVPWDSTEVVVQARGRGAGARGAPRGWARAQVLLTGAPARDQRCHAPPHDPTDDAHLLPKNMLPEQSNSDKK